MIGDQLIDFGKGHVEDTSTYCAIDDTEQMGKGSKSCKSDEGVVHSVAIERDWWIYVKICCYSQNESGLKNCVLNVRLNIGSVLRAFDCVTDAAID